MLFEEFQDHHHGRHLEYWNWICNSESSFHPYVSHQVSAQSDLPLGRRCDLNNFKMAVIVAILDIGTDDFSNSEFP